mmetsp:Transcript_16056/g.44175  ORF Transcript_16056/g.44175 Transcript_16056/m.44175 type:complete len:226 (+) Transcript_16056:601-1278(+)
MHSAAPLDDLDRDALVELFVEPVIDAADLQRALRMTIDALHLCVEDRLQLGLKPHQSSQDEELAITDGEHRDHGVQLAVDPRAVVEDRKEGRGGAECLRGLVSLPHQRDRAHVRPLHRVHPVRNELRHCKLLAGLEQLSRQLRRIQAVLLDLRHAVSHAQEHGGHQGDIGVPVAFSCLLRVSLLVGIRAVAQGLVLLVLLRQVLLPPLQLVQVVALPLTAHKEGG